MNKLNCLRVSVATSLMIAFACTIPTKNASAAGPASTQPAATGAAASRHFDHVLVIVLENQDQEVAIRDPYLKSLAGQGANLTDFHGVVHPSYANYLAMVAGKLIPTHGDKQIDIPDETIADRLTAKGLTWKNYAEGYPGNCFLKDTKGRYARKHVPFISFTRVQHGACQNVVTGTQFDKDLAALDKAPGGGSFPNYAFYSPDLDDDGHDTGLKGGTRWLKGFLDPLLQNKAFMETTLTVITYDESGQSKAGDTNHIYTVLLGDMVKPGDYAQHCNHYSVLRTVEDNFGLEPLADGDRQAEPITGVWKAPQ
jgi:hypothetical protein